MITDDYVSFEVAKLLKDKGFNGKCKYYYIQTKEMFEIDTRYHTALTTQELLNLQIIGEKEDRYAAPTQAITMRWLREVHKVHIIAEPCLGKGNELNLSFNRWFWTILIESGEYKPIRKIDEFPTYEQACEDAIKHSLKYLI